jgi:hypothetical protein
MMGKARVFTAVDLQPITQILPSGYPDGLREIAENLYMSAVLKLQEDKYSLGYADGEDGVLLEEAVHRGLLAQLAFGQTEDLSFALGGHGFYMQKGVSFRLSPRNRKMCEEFRGDYTVVARKYDLSEQQVRNIIDRWQHEQFAAKQKTLFTEPASAGRQRQA